MPTVDEVATAVSGLVSARVTGSGRTVNIAEVGFARGTVKTRLHAQCPLPVRTLRIADRVHCRSYAFGEHGP